MEKRNTEKEVADLFQSFNDCYNLILKNKNTNHCEYILDKDGVWKKLILSWVLEYYEYFEYYEKCADIKKYMDTDFIAPPEKQIILNKKMSLYV